MTMKYTFSSAPRKRFNSGGVLPRWGGNEHFQGGGRVGLKCHTYSLFFGPIHDIYGMINFSITMETERQQSVSES